MTYSSVTSTTSGASSSRAREGRTRAMTRIVLGVERVEQIGQWREHGASMWHDMGITAVKDAREG